MIGRQGCGPIVSVLESVKRLPMRPHRRLWQPGPAPNHRNVAFSDKTMQRRCANCLRRPELAVPLGRVVAGILCGLKGAITAVLDPPRQLVRSVRPAAFVAAVFVMTAAVAADAVHITAAQGRLDAEYTASLAGIPIGRGNWVIEISDDQFNTTATGGTTGLLRFFTPGHGASTSQGIVSAGQPLPTTYAFTISNEKRIDDVHMVFADGNVKDFTVDPPVGPHPDRIPVSEVDRHNVFDPLTSTLNLVSGSGDPVSPHACDRKVSIFDGRMRFDVKSEFKRMETVKAEKGYQGPVMVCAVYFVPVSGYIPQRYAIKYLAAMRDAEVWLAPIAGTRVVVPYRFSLPTPIGTGVLQATQFISVAKPPRAAANVKSQ